MMEFNWGGVFRIRCYGKDGGLKWVEEGHNTLATEGGKLILDTFFKDDSSAPTEFYIRLCNDTLVKSDTLSTVQNEPLGNGYSAQLVERSSIGWPTEVLDSSSDWKLTSKEVSFTASGGDIGPVNTMYIATTSDNVGILLAFKTFSTTGRTIEDGDTALIDYPVKLA